MAPDSPWSSGLGWSICRGGTWSRYGVKNCLKNTCPWVDLLIRVPSGFSFQIRTRPFSENARSRINPSCLLFTCQICTDYGLWSRQPEDEDQDDDGDKKEDEDEEDEDEEGGGDKIAQRKRGGGGGPFYEVYNRRTFGISEKDIVLDVHGCVQVMKRI